MENSIKNIFTDWFRRQEYLNSLTIADRDNEELLAVINNNIVQHKLIEDSLAAAIKIKYFNPLFLDLVRDILHGRTSYLLKLTALDYLLYNYDYILSDIFIVLNSKVENHSNVLVSFQAKLNLVCVYEEYIKYFLMFSSYKDSTFFYRFLNSLSACIHLRKVFKNYKNEILIILNKHIEIAPLQRDELNNA